MTESLSLSDHYDLSKIVAPLFEKRFKIDQRETSLPCLIPKLHPRDISLNPFRLRPSLHSQVIISYTDRKTKKEVIVARRPNQGGLHPAMLNRWTQQYMERKFTEKPEDLYYKHFLKTDPWILRPHDFRILFTDVEDETHHYDVMIDKDGAGYLNEVPLQLEDAEDDESARL